MHVEPSPVETLIFVSRMDPRSPKILSVSLRSLLHHPLVRYDRLLPCLPIEGVRRSRGLVVHTSRD
jgi:hypothetical protein